MPLLLGVLCWSPHRYGSAVVTLGAPFSPVLTPKMHFDDEGHVCRGRHGSMGAQRSWAQKSPQTALQLAKGRIRMASSSSGNLFVLVSGQHWWGRGQCEQPLPGSGSSPRHPQYYIS